MWNQQPVAAAGDGGTGPERQATSTGVPSARPGGERARAGDVGLEVVGKVARRLVCRIFGGAGGPGARG